MSIFDSLFGNRKGDDENPVEPQEFPWDRSPSIYEEQLSNTSEPL